MYKDSLSNVTKQYDAITLEKQKTIVAYADANHKDESIKKMSL
ncbi:MAG: hypothetical protein R2796_06080 [Chitinophagaceae bacterium]